MQWDTMSVDVRISGLSEGLPDRKAEIRAQHIATLIVRALRAVRSEDPVEVRTVVSTTVKLKGYTTVQKVWTVSRSRSVSKGTKARSASGRSRAR